MAIDMVASEAEDAAVSAVGADDEVLRRDPGEPGSRPNRRGVDAKRNVWKPTKALGNDCCVDERANLEPDQPPAGGRRNGFRATQHFQFREDIPQVALYREFADV